MKKEVKDILVKAGWYEGRKIDIDEELKNLENSGLFMNEKAKEFLREFGNLSINIEGEFLNKKNIHNHNTNLEEMKPRIMDKGGYWYLKFGDKDLKAKIELTPIISVDNGRYNIYISKDGRCYWENHFFADNIKKAWERLFSLHLEEQEIMIKMLEKIGWYKEREIDITDMVKYMEKRKLNNPVNENAQKFFRQFGELNIDIEYYFLGKRCIKHNSSSAKQLLYASDGELSYIDNYKKLKATPIICAENDSYDIFLSEEGQYYWERGEYAENLENMWRRLFGFKLQNKVRIICKLLESGWYKERRINIGNILYEYEKHGFKVFDKARTFLQEYGEMFIDQSYAFEGESHAIKYSIFIKDILQFCKNEKINYCEYEEKVIPVILINYDETFKLIYISETGKFYSDEKIFAEDIDLLWIRLINDFDYVLK